MAVTNAEAIRFVNEFIRPMSERLRQMKRDIDQATVTWIGGMSEHFPNTADAIQDGRESEGVSRLTSADVMAVVNQLALIQAQLNGAGVTAIISKPCVRHL